MNLFRIRLLLFLRWLLLRARVVAIVAVTFNRNELEGGARANWRTALAERLLRGRRRRGVLGAVVFVAAVARQAAVVAESTNAVWLFAVCLHTERALFSVALLAFDDRALFAHWLEATRRRLCKLVAPNARGARRDVAVGAHGRLCFAHKAFADRTAAPDRLAAAARSVDV